MHVRQNHFGGCIFTYVHLDANFLLQEPLLDIEGNTKPLSITCIATFPHEDMGSLVLLRVFFCVKNI